MEIFTFVDKKDYAIAVTVNGVLVSASKKKEVQSFINDYIEGRVSQYKIWPLIQKGYISQYKD